MDILGLSTSPSSGGAYALILNEVSGSRRLPIIIGSYEAQAIALELEHIKPPRPMTHDLMKQLIEAFDYMLKFIYISELKEGTFFSKMIFEGPQGEVMVDSRPSDAVALAIRFSSPIFVATSVLEEAGIVSDEVDPSMTKEADPKKSSSSKPATATNPESSSESVETRIELLQNNMDAAIQAEDYELAARLRDELQKLKGLL
jgi:bifunctional DNase/RNase